jgi:hypothetical protein
VPHRYRLFFLFLNRLQGGIDDGQVFADPLRRESRLQQLAQVSLVDGVDLVVGEQALDQAIAVAEGLTNARVRHLVRSTKHSERPHRKPCALI